MSVNDCIKQCKLKIKENMYIPKSEYTNIYISVRTDCTYETRPLGNTSKKRKYEFECI